MKYEIWNIYEKNKTLRISDEISVEEEEEDTDQQRLAWFRNFVCLISEYKWSNL